MRTKTDNSSFAGKVEATIRQKRLLKRGQCILVAASGGADSTAMLLALADLAEKWRLKLHVGHLHHGIRGRTADRDREFVRELAKGLGLPFHTRKSNVPGVAKRRKMSIEEAAREVRYAFLLRTARRIGASAIAVAHQADDQVETVLANILRGTGQAGISGMPYRRTLDGGVAVVRPMLDLKRSEVLGFLRRRHQGFVTDPTNRDTRYRRNRLRNELLPMLRKKFNPQVDASILRLAGQARSAQVVLDKALEKAWRRVVAIRSAECLVVSRSKFGRLPVWIQGGVLRRGIETVGGGLGRLGSEAIANLCSQLASAENGAHVRLGAGTAAVVDRDDILISRGKRKAEKKEQGGAVRVAVPGKTRLACCGDSIVVRRRPAKGFNLARFAGGKSDAEEMLDGDRIVLPLEVRRVRRGDAFRPLGAPGRVKVGDFFTNNKVPRGRRDAAKVLVDAKGIVWLIGHRLAHRVRVTAGTKRLLHVRL